MADYNIYIHAFSGESSATTPFQLKETSQNGAGSSSQGAEFVKKAASFVANPDSAISAVKNTAVGTVSGINPWVAAAVFVTGLAIRTSLRVYETYLSYRSAATGDNIEELKWTNFKQQLHLDFHPFSSQVEIQKAKLEIKIQNAKAEQERLLIGTTMYDNSARYL